MYKSILVPGLGAVCEPAALALARAVARMFDGTIEYLHVHPDPEQMARTVATMDVESSMFADQIRASIVEADSECVAKARAAFDAFCARETLSGDAARFRETHGDTADQIVSEALYCDLVVLGRPDDNDLCDGDAADVLVGSGRPILLAPSRPCANPLSTVAIAWKESAASVHAVAAAMPLLAKAGTIHVLAVDDSGDDATGGAAERLVEALAGHGLKARIEPVRADAGHGAASMLDVAANKLKAGVLVMGGYGHSRAREFVLGGFTRAVLHGAPLPVLLAH